MKSEEKPLEPPKWMHRAVYAVGAIILGMYIWMAYDSFRDKSTTKEKNNLEQKTNDLYQNNLFY